MNWKPLVSSLVLTLLVPATGVGVAHAVGPDDSGATDALEAEVDSLWQRRAEGATDGQASDALARRIVEACQRAVAARPESLRLRWKLLRAFHFRGEFAMGEDDPRLELFEQARAVADASRGLLSAGVGRQLEDLTPAEIASEIADVPHAIDIYFFSAIHWGLWGETTGKMQAARQGVGSRIRDFAEVVVLLDERYEAAGGHRFLGRLHTEAPRIPLVTGWVNRDFAVTSLERASELAPYEPHNLLFLADALLRFDRSRRQEAITILRGLVATPPRGDHLVEDSAAVRDAGALLAQAGEG